MSSTLRTESKPFITSPAAGGLLAAAAVLLLGGGLIPILGLHADTAIPLVLVGGVVVALVSLVVGITDHATQIAVLVVVLPLTFWAYVFAILYASTRPMMGGALFAGGLGFVAWSVVRLQRSRAQALVFGRRALQ